MEGAVDRSPVVAYVDWLLGHILKKGLQEVVLRSRSPLPGADFAGRSEGPPTLPPVDQVLNRLKVVAGLSPQLYPKPVKGVIRKTTPVYTMEVTAEFEDRPGDSVCRLRMTVRGSSAS